MTIKNFEELLKYEGKSRSVSIDTRTMKRGDIFFAINQKGHEYVKEALQKGASYVIVQEGFGFSNIDRVIETEDTFESLKRMGFMAKRKSSARIIGITGSVGKTTVRTWLETVLKCAGHKVCASKKNFNTMYGLPICLSELEKDTEFGIFELGTNNKGEIKELGDYLNPEIVLLTGIMESHIGNFGSKTALMEEKLSVIDTMQDGGVLIYNGDTTYRNEILRRASNRNVKTVSFGFGTWNDVMLTGDYPVYERNINMISSSVNQIECSYTLGETGFNHLMMSAMVLGVIYALGLDVHNYKDFFENLKALPGRGEIVECSVDEELPEEIKNTFDENEPEIEESKETDSVSTSDLAEKKKKHFTIIDDSYNASPTSVEVSMENLLKMCANSVKKRRSVLILGEMKELGEYREFYHERVAGKIDRDGVDETIFVGDKSIQKLMKKNVSKPINTFDAINEESIRKILSLIKSDDIVLIKGSRSIGLEKILSHVQRETINHTTTDFLRGFHKNC